MLRVFFSMINGSAHLHHPANSGAGPSEGAGGVGKLVENHSTRTGARLSQMAPPVPGDVNLWAGQCRSFCNAHRVGVDEPRLNEGEWVDGIILMME